MIPRCFAIDFTNPDSVVILQLALLIAHGALIFYRYKKNMYDLKELESRLDKFLPK